MDDQTFVEYERTVGGVLMSRERTTEERRSVAVVRGRGGWYHGGK